MIDTDALARLRERDAEVWHTVTTWRQRQFVQAERDRHELIAALDELTRDLAEARKATPCANCGSTEWSARSLTSCTECGGRDVWRENRELPLLVAYWKGTEDE